MRLHKSLSRRAAFAVALIAPPFLIGGLGLALMAIAPSTSPLNPSFEFIHIIGLVVALSAPFGGLSYLLVGGVLFWRAAQRGRDRALDYVITALGANFLAAVLAAPVVGLLAAATGFAPPQEAVYASFVVHGFGIVFAPLYGLVFGLLLTRLAERLGPEESPLKGAEAVFR